MFLYLHFWSCPLEREADRLWKAKHLTQNTMFPCSLFGLTHFKTSNSDSRLKSIFFSPILHFSSVALLWTATPDCCGTWCRERAVCKQSWEEQQGLRLAWELLSTAGTVRLHYIHTMHKPIPSVRTMHLGEICHVGEGWGFQKLHCLWMAGGTLRNILITRWKTQAWNPAAGEVTKLSLKLKQCRKR